MFKHNNEVNEVVHKQFPQLRLYTENKTKHYIWLLVIKVHTEVHRHASKLYQCKLCCLVENVQESRERARPGLLLAHGQLCRASLLLPMASSGRGFSTSVGSPLGPGIPRGCRPQEALAWLAGEAGRSFKGMHSSQNIPEHRVTYIEKAHWSIQQVIKQSM